ncbi:MAG: 4Fe-4S binding protein [Proteobacteria bacterium]|nr:4Fe-4S binding protein [Pseudomonadota bacterium]
MEKEQKYSNRFIQINSGIIGPCNPKPKTVVYKNIGDYPQISKAYLDTAKCYSNPIVIGPPICDELISLVQHMFTEEEASVVRHLRAYPLGKTAEKIAKLENRPVNEIREILDRLATEKRLIVRHGWENRKIYDILPIVPGTFEMALMRPSLDTLTDWHKTFAVLFEELWGTGYLMDFIKFPIPAVRYLPVMKSISALPVAWPSDKLEEVLDRYNVFAVGMCQCRMTEKIVERECGRPLENCTAFGMAAFPLINAGMMRRVEKKEIIDIKAKAEASGLVSWMFNEESGKGPAGSCSCCGCCCHMMRTVSEFNMPGMIAPPHFIPEFDSAACDYCGKCAKSCPMGAITVDVKGKTTGHSIDRCVGCGLCAIACNKKHAVRMTAVPEYKKPPSGWVSLIAGLAPNVARAFWTAWRKR